MAKEGSASIQTHFGDLTDPRVKRTRAHSLNNIIVIALCGVISGANNWVEIEEYGKSKIGWL